MVLLDQKMAEVHLALPGPPITCQGREIPPLELSGRFFRQKPLKAFGRVQGATWKDRPVKLNMKGREGVSLRTCSS